MNRFWENKSLSELTNEEWELLCDGCARCCLHKLEDEDTLEVVYTCAVCQYLDQETCTCTSYENRSVLVPECVQLTVEKASEFHWLPATCAYRLIAEGKPLPDWHPLISGNRESVHLAGASIRNICISETEIDMDEIENFILEKDDLDPSL